MIPKESTVLLVMHSAQGSRAFLLSMLDVDDAARSDLELAHGQRAGEHGLHGDVYRAIQRIHARTTQFPKYLEDEFKALADQWTSRELSPDKLQAKRVRGRLVYIYTGIV